MKNAEGSDRFTALPICPATEAFVRVPTAPGYYAIFIDTPDCLPSPFSDLLVQRKTTLVYIGIATRSLRRRLIEQDLLHRAPSTFFRGLGAILGFRPPPGSLLGRANQNNYRFSASDTSTIIDWIRQHLWVSWVQAEPAIEEVEKSSIRRYYPILNTDDNPKPVAQLAILKRECLRIARGSVACTEP